MYNIRGLKSRVFMGLAEQVLSRHFLGWQCRVRQIAMREGRGRPSPGMRPAVVSFSGEQISSAITLLLIPQDHSDSTAFFRFQAQRTHDPREAFEKGLAYLQESYYQKSDQFSDRMSGVFAKNSAVAHRCLKDGGCVLVFEQFSQSYRLTCEVAEVYREDNDWDAVFWHNRLFNPALTDAMLVLVFTPDWGRSLAEPPV